MRKEVVDWSDLPEELLPIIGEKLLSHVDILRFRSVCASWRSSILPSPEIPPWLRLRFPHPNRRGKYVFLSQRTIYRLEPPHQNLQPSASSSHCWLIKVKEIQPGRVRFWNPLSGLRIGHWPKSFPKVINLLDFRVIEVSKAYWLEYFNPAPFSRASKVVLYPNSCRTPVKDCMVFTLYDDGKLRFARSGDEKWTTLADEKNSSFDDIIVYRDQVHVVDRLGKVSRVLCSSLKLTPVSLELGGSNGRKHLVESCGELYVFDRNIAGGRRRQQDDEYMSHVFGLFVHPKTVNFEVYRLNRDSGTWTMMKNLGDRVFFLGKSCSFSVSAPELGCSGNCIYYTDGNNIDIFYLENHRKVVSCPDYPHVFWPPPSWLCTNRGSSRKRL